MAENSGGAHCLKYGFTTNHVTGLKVVTPEGDIVELGGGRVLDAPGYDLLGAFIGSEGTIGIVTKVVVRLLARPSRSRPFWPASQVLTRLQVQYQPSSVRA